MRFTCRQLGVWTLVVLTGIADAAAQDADDVSFTKTVAPLLVGRCGNCHIRQSSGGLSMATYATLMKGSDSGRVIQRRRPAGSRLVELISDGTMPKEGVRLSEAEVQAISDWIDAGAKFDGRNPRSPLTAFAADATSTPANTNADNSQPAVEPVSFSGVVAPLLVEHCTECHGADQPRAGLSMANFERFTAGGNSGAAFMAGKPDESLLTAKLKGTADGGRMPLDRDPLPDEQIAVIEQWIAAGAMYDSQDPTQAIEQVVELVLAASMTHEQLSARRAELAAYHWRLSLPEVAPTKLETASLRLWGNVDKLELTRIAELAEEEQEKVARMLKAPRSAPFIRGNLTLFVYSRHFEYAEFGLMVEGRQFPPGQTGHWRNNLLDAYGVLAYSPEDLETTLPALLNRLIAGNHIASHPGAPTWLADGCSRVVAARCHPKDPGVRSWQQGVSAALAAHEKPDEFFAVQTFDGPLAALSYGFAERLMSDSRRFQRLLGMLREGGDFQRSFSRAYGADPQAAFNMWAGRPAAGR